MRTQDIALLVLAIACSSTEAGEFVNLDFDSPDLSHLRLPDIGYPSSRDFYEAPIGEALRGWSLSWDSDPLFQPPDYIYVSNGNTAPLSLKSVDFTPPYTAPPYKLYVDSHQGPPYGPLRPPLHLYQVGTVPSDAVELWYYADWYVAWPPIVAEPPSILINDEALPFYPSPSGLAVNVARYAGQEVKLEVFFPSGTWQSHTFDIYGFVAVPEPSTCVLVLIGGSILLSWRLLNPNGNRPGRSTSLSM